MAGLAGQKMVSRLEQLDGLGKILVKENRLKAGDVLIIHSVSGRNNVPVEMAMEALRCPPGDSGVEKLSGGERRRIRAGLRAVHGEGARGVAEGRRLP